MARKTKEEALQTRDTILAAALDMFCERGYSRTTFDEIAKKINLTKGAVYWHFRNKPDIIKALIIETFESNQALINKEIPEVNTLDDLRHYFVFSASMVQNNAMFRKFLFFVMYQIEWSDGLFNTLNVSGPINNIINYHKNLIRRICIRAVENGEIPPETDVDKISYIMLCLWNGILYQEIGKTGSGDFPGIVGSAFQTFINSIKTQKDN